MIPGFEDYPFIYEVKLNAETETVDRIILRTIGNNYFGYDYLSQSELSNFSFDDTDNELVRFLTCWAGCMEDKWAEAGLLAIASCGLTLVGCIASVATGNAIGIVTACLNSYRCFIEFTSICVVECAIPPGPSGPTDQ